jgi:type IV fimbrial biogenesis protein FimT
MVLNKVKGFSLLEVLMVLSIIGILATVAAPSFIEWRLANAMKSVLKHTADIAKYGRALSITQRTAITLVLDPSSNHCISLTSDDDCDCSVENSCRVLTQKKRLLVNSYDADFSLPKNQKTGLIFDGTHGMSFGSALTITFSNALYTGKVIINNVGRVRYCVTSELEDIPQC